MNFWGNLAYGSSWWSTTGSHPNGWMVPGVGMESQYGPGPSSQPAMFLPPSRNNIQYQKQGNLAPGAGFGPPPPPPQRRMQWTGVQPGQPNLKRTRPRMQWTGDQQELPAKRPKSPPRKKNERKTQNPRTVDPALSYEEKLSLKIWNNYVEYRQTDELYAKKIALRRTLCKILEPFGNDCVFVVGSSINGFGSINSDLDLCLHITSDQSRLTNRLAGAALIGIKSALFASRLFSDVQYIPARVPILKFVDSATRIECDLNLNNTPGILNTRLLALYCALDWRVRPLGMYFKQWARQCDIHDASRGRLSSFALSLLLIHYLQSGCSPPVLPCLQRDFPDLFVKNDREPHVIDMSLSCIPEVLATWQSQSVENTQDLSELFTGLIEYYNCKADFSNTAFSVRLGRHIPMRVAVSQQPPEEVRRMQSGRSNSKIFVEEPFTLTNASRSPYDDTVYALVRRALAKTYRFLRTRKDIDSVPPV